MNFSIYLIQISVCKDWLLLIVLTVWGLIRPHSSEGVHFHWKWVWWILGAVAVGVVHTQAGVFFKAPYLVIPLQRGTVSYASFWQTCWGRHTWSLPLHSKVSSYKMKQQNRPGVYLVWVCDDIYKIKNEVKLSLNLYFGVMTQWWHRTWGSLWNKKLRHTKLTTFFASLGDDDLSSSLLFLS